MVLQDSPHCHAPIHPPAPVPTPSAHPALPLAIIKGEATVLIGNMPAARLTDTTAPCTLPGCVPGSKATSTSPSSVGTVIVSPSAACGSVRSTVQ